MLAAAVSLRRLPARRIELQWQQVARRSAAFTFTLCDVTQVTLISPASQALAPPTETGPSMGVFLDHGFCEATPLSCGMKTQDQKNDLNAELSEKNSEAVKVADALIGSSPLHHFSLRYINGLLVLGFCKLQLHGGAQYPPPPLPTSPTTPRGASLI